MLIHRNLIIAQAARHKVPAVYHLAVMVDDGGLSPLASARPRCGSGHGE